MPRPRRQEPDPEGLEEWGSEPEGDDFDPGEPPEMPAMAAEPIVSPSQALADLGPPPKGTLAAEKWAHSVLMVQAYETMMAKMPESQRRREVRTILRDARGHVTDAARYDYMKLVERDRAEMEAKKRGRAAAESVAVAAPPEGAKIIPMIAPDDAS